MSVDRPRLRRLLLLAALCRLPACAAPVHGPDSPTRPPPQWDTGTTPSAPAWPAPDWWNGFSSPELAELIAAAQDGNRDILAAAARVLEAQASARVAGAALLPAVDAQADASRRESAGPAGAASSEFGLQLSASYEIDFWGRNRANYDSAMQSLRSSEYDQATVALAVTAGVADAYFQVLSLRERLALARLDLQSSERILELVGARVQSGAAAPLDLAQQQAQVERQRAGIPPLEQQEREARFALAILLGRVPESFQVQAEGLDNVAIPEVAPGLPSELLARRPDIRREEARLAAAEADVRAAHAAFFPNLALTASTGFRSDALASLFDAANPLYAVAGALLEPVFSAGRLEGQQALAAARREELYQQYQGAILNAFADVERALSALQSLALQEQYQAATERQSQRALDLAEIRYRDGQDDLLPALDAQRALYQARDELRVTRLARLQRTVALYLALGGGWQDRY